MVGTLPLIKNTKYKLNGDMEKIETKRYISLFQFFPYMETDKLRNVEILTYKKEGLGLFGASLSRIWKEANATCDHL